MKPSHFFWIFLVSLLTFNSSYHLLASEQLTELPGKSIAFMSVEDVTKIIAENKPQIDVAIAGKKLQNISVTSSPSKAYSVFTIAVDAFTHCDSMLRMIIDNQRLQSVKGENFVELKFRQPVLLKIAYGRGKSLLVSKIVVPLSEQETSPEWKFYYIGESQDWFALRWTQADTKILVLLKQASQELVGS